MSHYYHVSNLARKSTVALALVAVLLITITVSSFEIADAALSSNTLFVPLYSWPVKYVNGQRMLSDSWQALYNTASANPNLKIMMILNPDNGNFGLGGGLLTQDQMATAQANPDILWAVQKMQSRKNISITGYVYTEYAARDPEICKQRIDLYKKLYGTTGILFDQMSSVAGNEVYYSNLDSYVKGTGMPFTVGNPGTSVPESYVGKVNTIIVYEDKGLPTISTLKARTFNGKYDKNNFGAIPHSVDRYDSTWVRQARTAVGYLYVTNDGPDGNPWDTLSSYTNRLTADLR